MYKQWIPDHSFGVQYYMYVLRMFLSCCSQLPPTERPEPPASATSSVHSMRGTEGEEAVSTTATKTAISPSHETPKRRCVCGQIL